MHYLFSKTKIASKMKEKKDEFSEYRRNGDKRIKLMRRWQIAGTIARNKQFNHESRIQNENKRTESVPKLHTNQRNAKSM